MVRKGELEMKKKKRVEDSGVYVIFVTILMILYQSLKGYTFPIFETRLSYSLFLLPFSFFIIKFINNRFDYKKAVAAIAISAVTFVCFTSIMSFILHQDLNLMNLSGEFCGYVASQFFFISLLVHYKKQKNFMTTISIMMLSLLIYQLFQTMTLLDTITFHFFVVTVFTTLFFQLIISLILGVLDKKEQ